MLVLSKLLFSSIQLQLKHRNNLFHTYEMLLFVSEFGNMPPAAEAATVASSEAELRSDEAESVATPFHISYILERLW